MHLLYCDESGTTKDPRQLHFLFAGLSVFERQTFWIASEMDKIAARLNPADPGSIEFHGSPMWGGKREWRSIPRSDRISLIHELIDVLVTSHKSNRIFLSVVNRQSTSPRDVVELTFEQISSRFDQYLMRLHRSGDSQRGLIVFDESTFENTIQGLANDFRTSGHRWGILRNLAEVPLFIDSRASRLIQLADIVAYSAFRHYEYADSQFFQKILPRLDTEGGVIHGLFERL